MNDWRVGMSNALAMPSTVANTITCQTVMTWVHTRVAMTNASAMNSAWQMRMVRRLSVRSASTPAYRVNSSTPSELSAETSPT